MIENRDPGDETDVVDLEAWVDKNKPEAREPKPDVLGLYSEAIWLISDAAKVSRGKVRRVLKAFEPLFWERLQEAYGQGIMDAYQVQAEQEKGTDEYTDDPEGTEGREASDPSETGQLSFPGL